MSCWAVGICAITDLNREKKIVHTSNSPLLVQRDDLLGDLIGVFEANLAHRAQLDQLDDVRLELPLSWSCPCLPTQMILTFLPSAIRALALSRARRTIDELNAPAQAALARADDEQLHVGRAGAAQAAAALPDCSVIAGGDVTEHPLHALGVGTRRLGRRLGAAKLGRRDHLHGLGDLLRRLGGGDAVAQVLQRLAMASLVSTLSRLLGAALPIQGRIDWREGVRRRP